MAKIKTRATKIFGFVDYHKDMNNRQSKKTAKRCRELLGSPVEGLKVTRKEIPAEDYFGGIFPPSDAWTQLLGFCDIPHSHYLPDTWSLIDSKEYFARRLQYTAAVYGDGLYYGRAYDGLNTHTPFTLFISDDRIVLHWYDQRDSVEVWAMPVL